MNSLPLDILRPSTKRECQEVVRFLAANMSGELYAEHKQLLNTITAGSTDGAIFVSREQGAVVGFACLRFEPYGAYVAAYLTYVLVVGAKRTDHSARLQQAAEDAARERTDRLYLRVTPDNERWAGRVMPRRGYEPMGAEWPGGYSKVLRPAACQT